MKHQTIETQTLANGLTLIIEPMEDVQSAAVSFLVPAGSVYDPPGQNGSASVLCELIPRGAGNRDSKQLSAALDNLGVQHSEGVGTIHLTFTAATLAENLPQALRVYADMILRPWLPENQFEASRAGVEQSLMAIEDEPRQKIMVELRRHAFDAPWGLPSEGSLADLPALSPQSISAHYKRCFRPDESILGIAGKVDVEQVTALIGELFGSWERHPAPQIATSPRGSRRHHIPHDSTQTHIGIAYDSVPYRDPEYYAAWAAVSVLSGGMSSRLFTEVRELRRHHCRTGPGNARRDGQRTEAAREGDRRGRTVPVQGAGQKLPGDAAGIDGGPLLVDGPRLVPFESGHHFGRGPGQDRRTDGRRRARLRSRASRGRFYDSHDRPRGLGGTA
jgi:predicted Zn-dependent peptidase